MMKVFKYLLLLLLVKIVSFITFHCSGILRSCSPPKWFIKHSAPAGNGQVYMLCSGSLPS